MAQQSSRLNRLLTLLDTGSTQSTRFAAARQIGDIAKSHPRDLASLLKKGFGRKWCLTDAIHVCYNDKDFRKC
ncbi:hypothetical protein NL676_012103 [Syzygium grande]|nr:hypothetical protein NL676_012103 [Syzygium grande]